MPSLVVRELRSCARWWPAYVGRGLYIALVGLSLGLFLSQNAGASRFLSPSQYAKLGRRLFDSLVALQMLLVTVGATMGAAEMMNREVRLRTLAILFVTPLSGIRIAAEKWAAALIQATLLMLSGLPALALCVYLGAVGVWDLACSLSVTLGMAALGAALGLRRSTGPVTVAGATWRALAELAGGSLALLVVSSLYPPVILLLVFVHPGFALLGLVQPGLLGSAGNIGWITATAAAFAASAWLVRSTGRRLHDLASRAAEPDPDLTEDRGLLEAGAAVRSWITETAVWEEEPLLWKELVTRPGVRMETYFGWPLLLGSLLVLSLMWAATGGISTAFLLGFLALVLTSGLVIGAGLFGRDRETRWNEAVHSTPVSSVALIRAKLLSGIFAPESLYLAGAGTVVVLGWTLRLGLLPALCALVAAGCFMGVSYLLAVLASMCATSTRTAFLSAAGVLAGLLLALPSSSVWSPLSVRYVRGPVAGLDRFLASLNPLIFLESSDDIRWYGLRVGVEEPLRALGSFVLTYAAAAGALLGLIAWRYGRLRRR